MYTFSSKLKTFSLILMVVGLLGIGYGFFSAPKNIQEVEAILASDAHGSSHGTAQAMEAHAPEKESHVALEVKTEAEKVEATSEIVDSAAVVKDSAEWILALITGGDTFKINKIVVQITP